VGEALVIEPNVDATADLYGGKQSIRALLVERSVAVPEVARAFTRALADFAK
jgi:hypothetical protein